MDRSMTTPEKGRKGRLDPSTYMRLSGMGLTMMAVVLAFTFTGHWLDGLLGWRFPLFTILLALVGIAGAIIHLIRETGRK
ncbi:MAG: AtpZ/AtpI family protein [Flavobacteriales bacterium]|mgnify:CR=1 FL=1|jgi:hypothetical protein|nr:AtpZ/AtpI family protein [Flavobacteriales bacterium]